MQHYQPWNPSTENSIKLCPSDTHGCFQHRAFRITSCFATSTTTLNFTNIGQIHLRKAKPWSIYNRRLADGNVHCAGSATHSLANNTVVQLRPKSTTGSSFLQEYIRYFCRRVWSINKQSAFLCVNNCLCPFMLNISLIFYINDFAGADTGTSLLYW